MNIPVSTYRIQLRNGVNFDTVERAIPYLAQFGVEWIYLSPIMAAAAESTHGYDVVDPGRIDETLGGAEEFERLCTRVQAAHMKLLIDIVPNHMSTDIGNRWWRDVLEYGRESAYAEFFDIRWEDDPQSRIVLPVLGKHYGETLLSGELRVTRDAGGFRVRYFEQMFPLMVSEVGQREALEQMAAQPESLSDQQAAALHEILEQQAYRLCYWRSGLGEINYRRFFDVSGLVALAANRPEVFERTHGLVLQLCNHPAVGGLRIDHVDGIADPTAYLRRLKDCGVGYLLVEKILGEGERLPEIWPVEGTTGYEFTDAITRLFVDSEGFRRLEARVQTRHGGACYEDIVEDSKRTVLRDLFAPSVRRLAEICRSLVTHDLQAHDVSLPELETGLESMLAAFGVYRTYVCDTGCSERDLSVIETALRRAKAGGPPDSHAALDFIARLLGGEVELPPEAAQERAAFVQRFQQLSGPVAAKGVEDTASYRWTALLALSEVGVQPHPMTDPVVQFASFLRQRMQDQPGGLNCTASHDTKRGEDARMRLVVLSELPDPWIACSDAAQRVFATESPAQQDEVDLLLQSYLAIAPVGPGEDDIRGRLQEYVVKAAREAKRITSWLRADPMHEERLRSQVDTLMDAGDSQWRRQLDALHEQVASVGALLSLGQVVLKIAAPGVPDMYQGTEGWDLTLVDPDNRRAVDFKAMGRRLTELDSMPSPQEALEEMRATWPDGRIKTWVASRALRARRQEPALFTRGDVEVVEASGARAPQVIALLRRLGDKWALAIAVRSVAALWDARQPWPLGEATWGRTRLRLPGDAPHNWVDALTGRERAATDEGLDLGTLFAELPTALLVHR